MNYIDPYQLLGVTISANLNELRQNYYKLALICHPDKGGNTNDMIILHNAYLYIKKQLEYAKNNKSVKNSEYDFKHFFTNHKEQFPSYYEIWKNTDERRKLEQFNRDFDNQKKTTAIQPFQDGYGHLLDTKETVFDDEIYQICKQLFQSKTIIKHIMNFVTCVTHEFTNEVIIYKEPSGLNCEYGSNERFDVTTVTDFSNINNELSLSDYKLAYNTSKHPYQYISRPESLDELIKERDSLDKLLL